MFCIQVDIPNFICEIDDELKAIYHSKDTVCIWVFDNEPRNKQITDRISQAIARGDKVVIWPSDIKEKDINDMVLSGYNVRELVQLNTYSGLTAKLKFNTWRK